MTKQEFVSVFAEKGEMTKKDADKALDAFFEALTEVLKNGGSYKHKGFGTFEIITRAAREGRNPSTGEVIQLPESKSVKFKCSRQLKGLVNEG